MIQREFLSVRAKYIIGHFIRKLFAQFKNRRRASLCKQRIANHCEKTVTTTTAFIVYEIEILITEILLDPEVAWVVLVLFSLEFGLFFCLKREDGCA